MQLIWRCGGFIANPLVFLVLVIALEQRRQCDMLIFKIQLSGNSTTDSTKWGECKPQQNGQQLPRGFGDTIPSFPST
ncbi:hypothetical protein FGO68_gene15815 [Halteria grandinella]|uniref:Secreted protein n=1 Tax=Halteria grandinella TaxID=5974 RepID=A0A8J8T4I1_HALGN|nr:hypothetical protein FGO68_gene15815 [Halteria grandinella]